jgi:hypothetical protein
LTPQEVYRRTLVENAENYAARLDAIIRNGADSDALRAIETLNSRVLGRPKETVETRQVHPDIQAVRDMTAEERDQLYWRLMEDETTLEPQGDQSEAA